jgi:hypothetical protein
VLAALAASSGCGGGHEGREPRAACPLELVPAYENAPRTVAGVLRAPRRVGIVVLGDNLPPATRLSATRRLQAAGVTVLAYTFTRRPGPYDEATFGTRAPATVEAQIRHAERTYHPDGIFVDNVPAGPERLAYFRHLARYIRSQPGGLVVLNGAASPGYLPLADVMVDFEGSYADYLRWRAPAWTRGQPARRFAQIVHSVPGRAAARTAAAHARRANAGYVLITDNRFPTPYDALPGVPAPPCSD